MDHRGRQASIWVVLGLLMAVGHGCQSTPDRAATASYEVAVPRSSPLSGASASDDWEGYRRDEALGIGYRPRPEVTSYVSTRIVDRRSTVNGRVRETGRATTRIIERSIITN